MRAFAMFLVGMLLGACARPQTIVVSEPTHNAASSAEDLVQKTVALVKPTDDGLRLFCTGVWVSQSSILTANHCVDEVLPRLETVYYATRDDLMDKSGAKIASALPHSAFVSMRDEAHDLALLEALAPPQHLAADLNNAPITVGEHVQVMGHPLGLLYSYSEGEVSAVRRFDLEAYEPGTTWIQATVPISPGNSGGGLFDAEGHLIGITTATFPRGQSLNVFVHRQHIAAFLAQS